MKQIISNYWSILLILFLSFSCSRKPLPDDYAQTLQLFRTPTADYSTAPFWVWNDLVSREKIDTQLRSYRDLGIMQLIIHPRPGLITPYLDSAWFGLVKYACLEAKNLGMKIWLYDENSYPSGFAGGNLPAEMPQSRASMIKRIITLRPDTLKLKIICKFQKSRDKYQMLDSTVLPKNNLPYMVFVELPASPSDWFGGYSYVDIMQKQLTNKFLDLTIGGYKKLLAKEFGDAVPGVFTDEPNISGVWGSDLIPYSPELFKNFSKKFGYDLHPLLPSLFEETGNWRKLRHDFYSTLLEMFIENWAVPYSEYCAKNNLQMTGHYWDHEWPRPTAVPDNMALDAYSQVPGIDVLMNNWYGGYSGQFGNNLMVRELASLANQLGRKRRLSETYGAAGWDLTFEDMKRIGDWEYALGVNLMNQHLSYMSIAGARKRDHPPSFSALDPWWNDYNILNEYFSRLSVALSSGKQENKILVIEPTTTAWMYYPANWSPYGTKENAWKEGIFGSIISSFHSFIDSLENWQVEYDLGSEDIIRKHARAESGKLVIGEASYSLVILPSSLENLDNSTFQLLQKYLEKGGIVLSTTRLPAYTEGQANGNIMELASAFNKKWTQVNEIRAQDISHLINPDCQLYVNQANGFVFHQRRKLNNFELIFIANASNKSVAIGSLTVNAGFLEKWDPFTGDVSPYPFVAKDREMIARIKIPPGGSLLLAVKKDKRESLSVRPTKPIQISFDDKPNIEPIRPNILSIDYCDLYVKDASFKEIYFYQANQKAFNAYGFSRDPWDNAVQFRSDILQKDTFSAGTGFKIDYWLNIDKKTSLQGLRLVTERPGIFKLSVNGLPLEPLKGEHWIDKSFAVFSLDSTLTPGNNCISLNCNPMSVFAEIEPIYILGNFRLKAQKLGFSLQPPNKLELGSWNQQGMQMYYDMVSYSHSFSIDTVLGRYSVSLGKWYGACSEVIVNNQKAGIIAFPPYKLDISPFVKKGKNTIHILVSGTLRNVLGPLHQASNGSAWPGMFQTIEHGRTLSGDSYLTLPYGLYDDFVVYNEK